MPPKQRQTAGKPKAKKGSSTEKEESKEHREASGGEGGAEQRRGKSGVSWTPVFKRIGIFIFVLSIPTLLNYAALNQETRMLLPSGNIT